MAKIMLKVAPPSGDPVPTTIGDEKQLMNPNKPKIDLDLDVRDNLAALVGRGHLLGTDDKAAIYGRLSSILGQDKAQ